MVEKFYRALVSKVRSTHQQVQVIIKKNKEKEQKEFFNEKALFLSLRFSNLSLQAFNLLGVEGLIDPEDEETTNLITSVLAFFEDIFNLNIALENKLKIPSFRLKASGNYSKQAKQYYSLLCILFWWVSSGSVTSCSTVLSSNIFNIFLAKFNSLSLKEKKVFFL